MARCAGSRTRLLFVGTEFGLFFTTRRRHALAQLNGGVPTIPFRDLAIQRRENDLVGATFGRGFFVLDDYSCLRRPRRGPGRRGPSFAVRDAWWYIPRNPLGGRPQPRAPHISSRPTRRSARCSPTTWSVDDSRDGPREAEKKLEKQGGDTAYPGWPEIEKERREEEPSSSSRCRTAPATSFAGSSGRSPRVSIALRGIFVFRAPSHEATAQETSPTGA